MNRREFLEFVVASAVTQGQTADAPTIALLGQALVRYDLRKESPTSFERTRELLKGTSVVFTNFEAAIQTSPEVRAAHAGLIHNAEPAALDCLREMGVNLLALSSNHAADLGSEGIVATIHAAEQRGMVIAGTGADISEAVRPGILRTSHGTIAMVGFLSGGFPGDSAIAAPGRPGALHLKLQSDHTWEPSDRERILAAIRSAAGRADWVLAYHHNHEYDEKTKEKVPESQQQIARLCVDAGATLYVAHGFPGIRGVEIYKGYPLFHGMGNFIFQTRRVVYYAADTAAWQGVVVKCQLGKNVVSEIRVYPVSLRETRTLEEGQDAFFPAGAPRPAVGEQAQAILRTFRLLCEELGTQVTVRDAHALVSP